MHANPACLFGGACLLPLLACFGLLVGWPCAQPTLPYCCHNHRGLDPEEPVTSSAFLCIFHDLEITGVFLDDIMMQPDQPDMEYIVVYETRSLRDTRELLKATSMDDAYSFVDSNSHPRLWRILAVRGLKHRTAVSHACAHMVAAAYTPTVKMRQIKICGWSCALQEHALENLDFVMADKAFVRSADYQVRPIDTFHPCMH